MHNNTDLLKNPQFGYTAPFKLPVAINSLIDPPNKERQEWIERCRDTVWWYSGNNINNYSLMPLSTPTSVLPPDKYNYLLRHFEFRDYILHNIGGLEVCLPFGEDDMQNIIKRGKVFYGQNPKLLKGKVSRCHENSFHYWEKHKNDTNNDIRLMTGYALSKDGMWRQHSWLLQVNKRTSRIIETTVSRVAYFGYILDKKEAYTDFV